MPVVPMREILDRAFAERYGVAAINIVDDLTLDAVLAAATELQAPLIVQTSLKTVKAIGAGDEAGSGSVARVGAALVRSARPAVPDGTATDAGKSVRGASRSMCCAAACSACSTIALAAS